MKPHILFYSNGLLSGTSCQIPGILKLIMANGWPIILCLLILVTCTVKCSAKNTPPPLNLGLYGLYTKMIISDPLSTVDLEYGSLRFAEYIYTLKRMVNVQSRSGCNPSTARLLHWDFHPFEIIHI